MGIISDILRLVRPAPGPGIVNGDAAPPAPPATVEGLVAMLGRIAAERGAAEATLAGAQARRAALLLEDGSDRAIRKIDEEVDAAHLLLERLDAATPSIHERLAVLRNDDAQGRWADLTVRYIGALVKYAQAMMAVEQAGPLLVELNAEAQRGGFAAESRMFMLYPQHLRGYSSAVIYDIARSYAANPPRASGPAAKTWTVEFLEWCTSVLPGGFLTAYQQGQQAGFNGPEGWALVDAGKAKWADPTDVPPKPPARTKRKAEATEVKLQRMRAASGARN